MEQTQCINCGQLIDGKFCKECGQKTNVKRIDLSSLAEELYENIFQVNKGFFFTLKKLFTSPGPTIRDYLNGKRKNHFKPIAYLLTLSTLYFLIVKITDQNTFIDDLISGWMIGATDLESKNEIPKIAKWFSDNYAYATLILLPVFSLASYLSFLKFEKNYLEHLVINSYITGQQAIIYSFFSLISLIFNHTSLESVPLLFSMLYLGIVYTQLFNNYSKARNILSSLLTYFLYLVFSILLLALLAGISEL